MKCNHAVAASVLSNPYVRIRFSLVAMSLIERILEYTAFSQKGKRSLQSVKERTAVS